MNNLNERLSRLTPAKRALFEKRLKGEGPARPKAPEIPRRKASAYPLLFDQEQLWVINKVDPAAYYLHISNAYRMKGPLDVEVLERAVNEIVRRHENLRTAFVDVDGRPVPVIAPSLRISIPRINISHVPEEEREAEMFRLLDQRICQPFDLSRPPLLRTALLRLSEREHTLLVVVHHIVVDRLSSDMFAREMAILYDAFSKGEPSPLPELPIQYGDYAAWQHQSLQGGVMESHFAYWKEKLAHAPTLTLPTDYPRQADQTFPGKRLYWHLPTHLWEAMKAFSAAENVTRFVSFLGLFSVLLYRYTGQGDFVVGSPINTRDRKEVMEIIGYFLNMLGLRVDLSGDPTFRELLGRLRQVTTEALMHRELSIIKIQQELRQTRNSIAPLYQVNYVFVNNETEPAVRKLDLSIRSLPIFYNSTPLVDLQFNVFDEDDEPRVSFDYNTALFARETIERMIGHLRCLMESALADPDQRISEMQMLGEGERRRMLFEWNDTRREYPRGRCIHELFEEQVERAPDAVALVFEGHSLSYRELNERANRLAHRLRRLGVGPDVLVGISTERSVEMVTGLLGILKAGGAYLPLDPEYPPERLAFMLEDAGAPVLLTQAGVKGRLAAGRARVICLDTEWESVASEDGRNPRSGVGEDHLAYVIYTSGSTGRPKGVMIPHRGIRNRLQWMQEAYGLDDSDRVLQKTPFSFDVSVWEFFWPLMTGARLVVAQPGGHRDGGYLAGLIAEEGITTLHFVPSMLRQFLEAEGLEGCRSLRRVICSGEALTVDLQELFFERLGAELHNLYGPTEASVDVTSWACERGAARRSVPIGRPIANTQMYVLDAGGRPVPAGVAGELHIGGVCLARGYLNRPALTAERFVPDPFSGEPGARLYRTGDLGCYLPGGEIEYLGRLDHQVKVRGFRIELGEVEAALASHPSVRQCVVTARDEAAGKQLVAYVVPQTEEPAAASELRRHLQRQLPEYMVPAVFLVLNALPLTPNGKVDRKALPEQGAARAASGAEYVAPREGAERTLARIWREVLGLEVEVGAEDNFFELGGDSILALQVVAKANRRGLHLAPRLMFTHQTVRQLASAAGTVPAVEAEQGLVTGEVPLTHTQRWFFERDPADPHHFNQSVMLEVQPGVSAQLLEQSLERLLLHHDALRLRFERRAEGWRQFIGEETQHIFSHFDLSGVDEAARESKIEELATGLQASLNLHAGPLVRAALFGMGEGRAGRLLLIVHHLAIDGVSWRILLEDFQSCCEQLQAGGEVTLPPKTTSFKRWAERSAEYAQTDEAWRELDYWLAEARPAAAPLPLDFAVDAAANTEGAARTARVGLTAEETRALLRDVPQTYHTRINDVLLAALAQSFAEWTGRDTLRVDLEGHGREEISPEVDVSRTVGWFTTIFPTTLRRRAGESPGELLRAIKESVRQVPRGGLGYGLLRHLSPDGRGAEALRRAAAPEVSFNYLGQLDHVLGAGALFAPAKQTTGPTASPRARRSHLIEVEAAVYGGELEVSWRYSVALHKPETIERLAQAYVAALRQLIGHCLSGERDTYTPSDFPHAELSAEGLTQVLRQIGLSEG